jgi:hypothetical protein
MEYLDTSYRIWGQLASTSCGWLILESQPRRWRARWRSVFDAAPPMDVPPYPLRGAKGPVSDRDHCIRFLGGHFVLCAPERLGRHLARQAHGRDQVDDIP